MRILCLFGQQARVHENSKGVVIVGRPKKDRDVDLDLSPDTRVSRPHARIGEENGEFWVEDLGSVAGTYVDAMKISGGTRFPLTAGSLMRMGETLLRVQMPNEDFGDDPGSAFRLMVSEEGQITHVCDASSTSYLQSDTSASRASVFNLLCELPLQLAQAPRLEDLLQTIVQRLVEIIQGASHGAILLLERANGQLVLKAHHPAGGPSVSLSCARQTIERKEAMMWSRPVSGTQVRFHVTSSLYAPILRNGEVLGVLSVDSVRPEAVLTPSDLQLLVLVAHYAGIAVENCYLRDDLRRHRELAERLFCSRFPGAIRQQLLRDAVTGSLVTGTRQSEVAIVAADIRGFTQLTSRVGPLRMKDILEQYFPAMIHAVHQYDGTVERFVGDALFAVFGSPVQDDKAAEKAVRAALKMQEAVAQRNSFRSVARLETCSIGIGIHCGEAVHGFIGNAEHMDFAVLGEPANLAGRYCSAAGSAEILVSAELYSRAFHILECESLTITTKHEGELPAFRVKALR